MAKPEPPVLADPESRKRYDDQWQLYPYEHPNAYWLRGGQFGLVCTRCGESMSAHADVDDFASFVAKHLACPLGHGLDSRGGEVHDPLFSEEVHNAEGALPDPGAGPAGADELRCHQATEAAGAPELPDELPPRE